MRSFPWCSRRKTLKNPPFELKQKVQDVEKEVAAVVEELIKSVDALEVAIVEAPVEAPVEVPVEVAPVEVAAVDVPVEVAVEARAVKKKSKKLPAGMYNHPIWPSPRAVNLVRHILMKKNLYPIYKKFANSTQVEGRLSHEKALNALASFAGITVDVLLTMSAGRYHDTYLFKENISSHTTRYNYYQTNYELYGI